MSPALLLLAGHVARPRGRRPQCAGSRYVVAAGCVHDDGTVWCPVCHMPVAATGYLPRVVALAVHRERKEMAQ